MDPSANLDEQRELSSAILRGEYTNGDADRLAELVEALDEWISKGGAIPRDWER